MGDYIKKMLKNHRFSTLGSGGKALKCPKMYVKKHHQKNRFVTFDDHSRLGLVYIYKKRFDEHSRQV